MLLPVCTTLNKIGGTSEVKSLKTLFSAFVLLSVCTIFAQRLKSILYIVMKKYILDLTVTENVRLHAHYVLLKLTSPQMELPEMLPGQFAEIRVDGSPTTFLRRPISINPNPARRRRNKAPGRSESG